MCNSDSILLSAPTGTSYLWAGGETTQSKLISAQGLYSVSYLNDLNDLFTINFNVHGPTPFTFDLSSVNCDNEPAVVSVINASNTIYYTHWNLNPSADENPYTVPDSLGSAWLKVEVDDIFDCNSPVIDSVFIGAPIESPIADFLLLDSVICYDEVVPIFDLSLSNDTILYTWNYYDSLGNFSLLNTSYDTVPDWSFLGPNQTYGIGLVVENSSGCSDTLILDSVLHVLICFVENQENSISDLTIYPNPFTNFLRVNSSEEMIKAELYTITGIKLTEFKLNKSTVWMLDFIDYPPGSYILSVWGEMGHGSIKIVKI